ncbi:MAG: hypothetical protein ACKO3F_00030 [Cyanobium sp.]
MGFLTRATNLILMVVFALLRFATLLESEPHLAAGRREALRWA